MTYRPIPVDEVIAALPIEEQAYIRRRGEELVAKVRRRMSLAEIRKGRKISQAAMAEVLGIGQMQISRLEKRRDPRLSTVKRTVEAMGGQLTLIATFPGQEPIILIPPQAGNDAADEFESAVESARAASHRA